MGWEIVFFVLALAVASKVGAKALASAFNERRRAKKERRAHKSQLVTNAIADGVAPKVAKEAADAAARAAVTVSTWAAVWIAAKNAWLKGWKEGHERGVELRDGTKPHESAGDGPTQSPESEGGASKVSGRSNKPTLGTPSQSAFCELHYAETEALYRELAGRNLCVYEADYKTCPVGHKIPLFCGNPEEGVEKNCCALHQTTKEEKGKDMTIETQTGGEVLTKEQYKAEVEAVIKEANAELEDAQGDIKRAQQDVARVETMSASLVSAQIDRATVDATRVLVDTNPDRIRLAKERIAAAEQRKAAAERCLQTLNASAQNSFYAA